MAEPISVESNNVLRPWFDLSHVRADLLAGVTTGVVALPLALAFGEASGAGPMAGLWGAIILGFIAALLGGNPDIGLRPDRPDGRGVRRHLHGAER